jgi:hypothetical protein
MISTTCKGLKIGRRDLDVAYFNSLEESQNVSKRKCIDVGADVKAKPPEK